MPEIRNVDFARVREDELKAAALKALKRHFADCTPVPGRYIRFEHSNLHWVATLIGSQGAMEVRFPGPQDCVLVYPASIPPMGSEEQRQVEDGLGALREALQGPQDSRISDMLDLLFSKAGWSDKLDADELKLVMD